MRDLANNIKHVQSLAIAPYIADANGDAVDLANTEAAGMLVTAGAWTDGQHTFVLEQADKDASGLPGPWSTAAEDDLQGVLPVIQDAGGDVTSYFVGYTGHADYLRVALTVAGATTGLVAGGFIVLGKLRYSGRTPFSNPIS